MKREIGGVQLKSSERVKYLMLDLNETKYQLTMTVLISMVMC